MASLQVGRDCPHIPHGNHTHPAQLGPDQESELKPSSAASKANAHPPPGAVGLALLRARLQILLGQNTSGLGTSLVVQRVRLRAPNAGVQGSIPGRGTRSCTHAATKSPQATAKTQHSLDK